MPDTLQQAISAHQQGDFDTAKRLYEDLLAKQPDNADLMHLLAILWGQQEDFTQALSFAERAIEKAPQNPSYLNTLGNIQKHLGQAEKAENTYRQVLSLAPDSPTAYSNLANLLAKQDRCDEAKALYLEALKRKPDYLEAQFNLALLYLKTRDLLQAEQAFNKVVTQEPHHFEAQRQLGQLLQQQNKLTQAIKHYQESLKFDPQNVETTVNLGTALISHDLVKKGIETIQQALVLEPEHYEANYNLGAAYLAIKKPQFALEHFLKILDQKPNPDVFYNVGVIKMYQENHGEAIAFLKETLKLEPNYLAAHINLGVTYLKIEDIKNAVKHYQIVLEAQPNNVEVKYLLDALTQQNQPDAAPLEYVKTLFDQYAPYFDKHLTEYLDYKTPQMLLNAVQKVTDTTSLKVIDLGCGTGLAGAQFKPMASRLIGIDISEKMIEAAREKNLYDDLICENITSALQRIDAADLIIAADVFNYQGDLSSIFNAVANSLSPNGLFAFTVEKSTTDQDFELQTSARYCHSEAYLKRLSDEHGFENVLSENCTLRLQKKEPITGIIFICKRK